MRLKDKVAIVTGGSSGIGRAIALGYVREGAKVVIAALRQDDSKEVVNEIKKMGGDAIYAITDVSNLDDQNRLLAKSLKKFGKLDILVNDAAYSAREEIFDVTPESWDKQINVGLKGLFFLSQSFAKQLIQQGGGGRIINIGSVAGVMDFHPVSIAYHVAKAGVIHLTRIMGVDLAKHKITVNCIGPGSTATHMSSSKDPQYREYMTKGIPEGRFANPEEIVPPAVMFASDEAEYITGQTLFVEGGALGVYLGRSHS
jgi:NAD(P)-dependent dehydrogenase (short-subunit alcohol dehydrogenase family)